MYLLCLTAEQTFLPRMHRPSVVRRCCESFSILSRLISGSRSKESRTRHLLRFTAARLRCSGRSLVAAHAWVRWEVSRENHCDTETAYVAGLLKPSAPEPARGMALLNLKKGCRNFAETIWLEPSGRSGIEPTTRANSSRLFRSSDMWYSYTVA